MQLLQQHLCESALIAQQASAREYEERSSSSSRRSGQSAETKIAVCYADCTFLDFAVSDAAASGYRTCTCVFHAPFSPCVQLMQGSRHAFALQLPTANFLTLAKGLDRRTHCSFEMFALHKDMPIGKYSVTP